MASVCNVMGSRIFLSKILSKPLFSYKNLLKTKVEFRSGCVSQHSLSVESAQTDGKQPFTTSPVELPNLLVDARRVDPSTMKQVLYLDTLAVAKMLEKHGFSRENSEGLTQCLSGVVSTTLEHQARHMVTKPQQEIVVQQLMSEISSVKKDMVLLQKTEFSTLRNETEKQALELRQMKDTLHDEIIKISGKITLDINLERGRAIEAHAENEKKLQQLHNKIEMEVAHLRTTYEQYRNDVFKYAAGTVLTCAGLCLGIIRMWSH